MEKVPLLGSQINFYFKFSVAVGDDEIILGDLKEYILAERNQIRIEKSDHPRFLEDQTIFKTVTRYKVVPMSRTIEKNGLENREIF